MTRRCAGRYAEGRVGIGLLFLCFLLCSEHSVAVCWAYGCVGRQEWGNNLFGRTSAVSAVRVCPIYLLRPLSGYRFFCFPKYFFCRALYSSVWLISSIHRFRLSQSEVLSWRSVHAINCVKLMSVLQSISSYESPMALASASSHTA